MSIIKVNSIQPFSGDTITISGSLNFTSSLAVSASYAATASYATTALTASYAANGGGGGGVSLAQVIAFSTVL
jgi:hypothetical protein